MFDIVIPAGGEIDGDYRERAGTSIRALSPIGPNRVPVLKLVVDALRGSGKAGTIVVIGPVEAHGKVDGVDRWLPEGLPDAPQITAGPANIIRGLREMPADRPALVCTSDLPFLTASAVDDFASRIPPGVSISAGLVSAQAYLDRFPDSPPSQFVSLVEMGPVTMGGLFAIRPNAILDNMTPVMNAFDARKSQWRMIRLLGAQLAWQFATRRLSVESIRARIERILSCRIGIVPNVMPETAFDIDTPEDYAYADARV